MCIYIYMYIYRHIYTIRYVDTRDYHIPPMNNYSPLWKPDKEGEAKWLQSELLKLWLGTEPVEENAGKRTVWEVDNHQFLCGTSPCFMENHKFFFLRKINRYHNVSGNITIFDGQIKDLWFLCAIFKSKLSSWSE